ncbi:MAG: hypothetical protein HYV34_00580 [Candidatus Kerfeldbacteria bacterium]|nr:hypothetical protein [Candidatus Kerfeldbacteria bacterium]
MTLSEAQGAVLEFAKKNGWEDYPNIDKFDHIHEELLEMSQFLRYKSREEREKFVSEHQELFEKELGDVLFGLLRLANQLGVDAERGFLAAKAKIEKKYTSGVAENKTIHQSSGDSQFGSPS